MMPAKTKISGDNWVSYHMYSPEGLIRRISLDDDLANESKHNSHQYGRSIRFDLDENALLPTGLPVDEINGRLIALQEKLIGFLERSEVDCRFTGIVTFGGYKEFHFQVDDFQTFDFIVTKWGAAVQDFSVELIPREGWEYFDRYIRPDEVYRQQIEDQKLIDRMIEAGSNPNKLHFLEHTFRGKPDALSSISEVLKEEGFIVEDRGTTELVAGKESELMIDGIFGITANLVLFARESGAEYAGWGARLVI